MDDNNRELYISEFIINYLQTHYPNEYSDDTIISNYRKYFKLNTLYKATDGNLKKKRFRKIKNFNCLFLW